MSIPKEVQEYFKDGRRKLVKISANEDYSLVLKFNDGEIRVYEMEDSLTGVLSMLRDKKKFSEVFIDEFGNIAWDKDCNIDSSVVFNNRIDVSADTAYIYGRRLVDEV